MVATKYHNVPTVVDGIRFDSKKEAHRWSELKLLQRAGQISDLRRQVRHDLVVNGIKICAYVADFTYTDEAAHRPVVEDVKGGIRTREYILKKKLMRACLGIEITEV